MATLHFTFIQNGTKMNKGIFVLLAALALPGQLFAATRDILLEWAAPTHTVDGDLLDQDGDGVPELLTGFRLYFDDANNTLINDYQDNLKTSVIERLNLPFGQTCFKMTAYNDSGESAYSNISCRDINPGKPEKPTITN